MEDNKNSNLYNKEGVFGGKQAYRPIILIHTVLSFFRLIACYEYMPVPAG